MPSVTGVDYGEQAVERLSAIARAVRWAGWVAFVVLLGATLIIVSATLQLAIYARREEMEIQKLVGATDRFVKAPFLLEGGLQGLAGAALAIAGLIAFRQTLSPQLASLLTFLRLPGTAADARPWMEALELALAGAGLGWPGATSPSTGSCAHEDRRLPRRRAPHRVRRTGGRGCAENWIRSRASGRWCVPSAPSPGTPRPRSPCTRPWPGCRPRAPPRSPPS